MFEGIGQINAANPIRPTAGQSFVVPQERSGSVERPGPVSQESEADLLQISDRAVALYEARGANSDPVSKTEPRNKKGTETSGSFGEPESPVESGQAQDGVTVGAQDGESAEAGEIDEKTESTTKKGGSGQELTEVEVAEVTRMKKRDQEVRAHEQAHKAVAGSYGGAIHYDYETGPDRNRYIVSGHVPIDMSEIPDDPQRTAEKMEVIQRAAMAPVDPSAADRNVASRAARIENKARMEVAKERYEEAKETRSEAGDGEASAVSNEGSETSVAQRGEDVGSAKATEGAKTAAKGGADSARAGGDASGSTERIARLEAAFAKIETTRPGRPVDIVA